VHLGDAHVAESGTDRRLDVVHRGDPAAGIVAVVAARPQHHQLLAHAVEQRPVRIAIARPVEAEGAPDAHDVVDPRLEPGRHAEVVHRYAGDDEVGGQQFVDQRVALRQRFVHPGLAPRRWRERGMDPVAGHGRWR